METLFLERKLNNFVISCISLIIFTCQIYAGSLKSQITQVVVSIDVCGEGQTYQDIEVTFEQMFEPYDVFIDTTDANGQVFFLLPNGQYNLTASKPGFNTYNNQIGISGDVDDHMVVFFTLTAIPYPIRNLSIDTSNNIVSWSRPKYVAFPLEDFENESFPPEGWKVYQSDSVDYPASWERRNTSYPWWQIPPLNEDDSSNWFASIYEQELGFAQENPDWLIMPPVDLRLDVNFKLSFDVFHDSYFDNAELKYSYDGENWLPLLELDGQNYWQHYTVDLNDLNPSGDRRLVTFAFKISHGDMGISKCAIDNVSIIGDYAPIDNYYVYKDDVMVAIKEVDDTTYLLQNVIYGQDVCVSVYNYYACSLGGGAYSCYTSSYLYPPKNLADNYQKGKDFLKLVWFPPNVDTSNQTDLLIRSVNKNVLYIPQLQHAFDLNTISSNESHIGAGCDGKYIYSTSGNSNTIFKYDIHGTLIDSNNIQGIYGITDLAYDGNFMYGVDGSNIIYKIDFENNTLVTSFTIDLNASSIAFDESENAFWVNNSNSDIYLFTENNQCIDTISNNLNIKGSAYKTGTYNNDLYVFVNNSSSLAEIQNYNLTTENLSGNIIEVSNDLGSVGAGGLYIIDNIYFKKTSLGGTAVGINTDDIGFAYDIDNCQWPVNEVVPGLVSFNIYRNDSLIANRPYNEEGINDSIFYNENNLEPYRYSYNSKAVYDITAYGFLNDTAMSCLSNTDLVSIVWGKALPFDESWDEASFYHNNWKAGERWVIDNSLGNDAPSAKFIKGSEAIQYSSSLESTFINCDSLSEGNFYLDFDIKLNGSEIISGESLKIQLKSRDTDNWTNLREFTNDSSFDWKSIHLQIDDFAKSNIFKFRFLAEGENALAIDAWFVDNIKIYRLCEAPFNLNGEYVYNSQDDFGAEICWNVLADSLKNKNKRSLSGFNIYRMSSSQTDFELYSFVNTVDGVTDYCFFDAWPAVDINNIYSYKVSAVYNGEADFCESVFALSANDQQDYVEILVTQVEQANKKTIHVFPNPATDKLNIISEDEILRISLTSIDGKISNYYEINSSHFGLNLSSMKPGLYMLKIYFMDGVVCKKQIIR